jgi:hypothetical protein
MSSAPGRWIGLVRKQNSGAGKQRRGGITNQGNRYLRQMRVVGALGNPVGLQATGIVSSSTLRHCIPIAGLTTGGCGRANQPGQG